MNNNNTTYHGFVNNTTGKVNNISKVVANPAITEEIVVIAEKQQFRQDFDYVVFPCY